MKTRKATLCDAAEIHALMQPFVNRGVLLPRTVGHICENIRDFTVIEDDGRIVASGALHCLDEDVAEVQSLAVSPEQQRKGLGSRLVRVLLKEARALQTWKAFALTHDPGFFKRNGFELTDRALLPQKFARDCSSCPKLLNCRQVAVVFDVFAAERAAMQDRSEFTVIQPQACAV